MKGTALLCDPALPGLAQALQPQAMTSRLAPLALLLDREGSASAEGWQVVDVKILKHAPGRRCALGYTLLGPGGRRRLFGKILPGDRGRRNFKTLGKIAGAIPRDLLLIPRPVGHLPDLGLLVTEYLDGGPLAPSLYGSTPQVAARRSAEALATLHGCAAPLVRSWSARRELTNTGEWLSRSPLGAPLSSGRAKAVLQALERRAELLPQVRETPVHRDFYPEQVWDCHGQSALLDLDDARLADPALDVGNFLAHLKLRSLQFPSAARGCEEGRPAFLEAYESRRFRAANEEGFHKRVAFYEAASLLRLSGVYSLRERWADRLPRMLLDSCEAGLNALG